MSAHARPERQWTCRSGSATHSGAHSQVKARTRPWWPDSSLWCSRSPPWPSRTPMAGSLQKGTLKLRTRTESSLTAANSIIADSSELAFFLLGVVATMGPSGKARRPSHRQDHRRPRQTGPGKLGPGKLAPANWPRQTGPGKLAPANWPRPRLTPSSGASSRTC